MAGPRRSASPGSPEASLAPAEPQVTGQGCFSAAYKGWARSPSLQGHSLWLWCGSGHGCTGICPQLWHGATLGGFLGPRADGQEGDTRGRGKGRHQKPQVSYNAWEAGSTTDALTVSCCHGHPEGRFLTGASPPSQGVLCSCLTGGTKAPGSTVAWPGFPGSVAGRPAAGARLPGSQCGCGKPHLHGSHDVPRANSVCDLRSDGPTQNWILPSNSRLQNGTCNTDSWPFDSIANSARGGEMLMLFILSSAARKVRLWSTCWAPGECLP